MVQFWEVTCDGCQTWGMVSYRYKCLRCEDFDLCAACHERGLVAVGHDQSHPFQCLMDRATRELHFAGEPIPELCADSFTCPVCGEMGHSAEELVAHVQARHPDARTDVICPLCVAVPLAHPARVSNIVSHLSTMHRFRPSEGFRMPEVDTTATVHTLPSAQVPQVRFILPTGLRLANPHLALPEDLSDTEVAEM